MNYSHRKVLEEVSERAIDSREKRRAMTPAQYLLVYGVPNKQNYAFLAHALKAEQAQSVLVPEMRPQLWGARVVARELLTRNTPATLISDNMMGTLVRPGPDSASLYLFYERV